MAVQNGRIAAIGHLDEKTKGKTETDTKPLGHDAGRPGGLFKRPSRQLLCRSRLDDLEVLSTANALLWQFAASWPIRLLNIRANPSAPLALGLSRITVSITPFRERGFLCCA